MAFPALWGKILWSFYFDGQKTTCSLSLAPGSAQSEPIVVPPLTLQYSWNLTKENWNSLFTPTVDACLTFNLYFRWWLYDSSSWLADSRITLNYNNYIMFVFWYLHVICSVSPPGVCLSALRFIFPKMKQLHGINFQICRIGIFCELPWVAVPWCHVMCLSGFVWASCAWHVLFTKMAARGNCKNTCCKFIALFCSLAPM